MSLLTPTGWSMCIKLNCQVEAAAGNFHFSRSLLVSIDSDETCPPDSWLEFRLRISPCLFFDTHYHCSCSFLPELVVEAVPVSVMLTVAIPGKPGRRKNPFLLLLPLLAEVKRRIRWAPHVHGYDKRNAQNLSSLHLVFTIHR